MNEVTLSLNVSCPLKDFLKFWAAWNLILSNCCSLIVDLEIPCLGWSFINHPVLRWITLLFSRVISKCIP